MCPSTYKCLRLLKNSEEIGEDTRIDIDRGRGYVSRIRMTILGFAIFASGVEAVAAESAGAVNSGDTAWILLSAALVMLMTPAVGLFYGGMVRKKNVLGIITQSFIVLALVSIQWVMLGYSLAFGPDVEGFFGGIIGSLKWVGLEGVGAIPNANYAPTIPHLTFAIYQAMFAIITPALVIGAFADRVKFSSFIVFTILWSTLVYDPIAHWVWGTGGWVKALGALDFAGGTVVHVSAGVSALVAALLIGTRYGFGFQTEMRPHNITMSVLGASLLWFGWFGFNAGSALSAGALATQAFVTTNTAAAAAGLSWMSISWVHHKKPSSLGIVTGAVCGLVAITPAAGFVNVISAVIIGILAGLICYTAMVFRTTKTGIDDSLDVFSCHGVGGVIGSIATGIFAQRLINPNGADGLLAGNPSLLVSQLIAVGATALYAGVMTALILIALKTLTGIRVKPEEEVIGLDISQHGEEAYPDMDVPA
jgi:Amt family ammonium transporter